MSIAAQNPSGRFDLTAIGFAVFMAALCVLVGSLRASYLSPPILVTPAQTGSVGWRVTEVISQSPSEQNQLREWVGKTLTRACATQQPQQCVALNAQWLIETPLKMLRASDQAKFIREQQALLQLGSAITLWSNDGQSVPIRLVPYGVGQFDESIYSQVLAVLLFSGMGCALLMFVRRSPEVWFGFAMCYGYGVFMIMRVWYTSRNWAQPELHWWFAMNFFKLGVVICAASALAIIWRLRLGSKFRGLLWGLVIGLALTVTIHAMGFIDSVFWGYRLPTLICLVAIVGAGIYSAISQPTATTSVLIEFEAASARAAKANRSRFFAKLISFGFIPALLTNTVWAFSPQLTAIAALNNFAVATAGVPLIILVARSSEYAMQRFWWSLWLVLITSTLTIVGAGVVSLVLPMSSSHAILVIGAAASWFVFLVRKRLARALLGEPIVIAEIVPQLMRLPSLGPEQANLYWQQVLAQAFDAYQVKPIVPSATTQLVPKSNTNHIELYDEGDVLLVPDLRGSTFFVLYGASQFSRTFNLNDVNAAQTLLNLARQGLDARESYTLGAAQERQRIAADLHDDIGGKLLHLASVEGKEGIYARQTLEDLRTITRGLNAQPRPLGELLADLQFSLGQRAERRQVDFEWTAKIAPWQGSTLGAHQSTVLVSICSELLRNALQYTSTTQVHFEFKLLENQVTLRVINNGQITDPKQWTTGLGTTSLKRRINDLKGQCEWLTNPTGGVIFAAQWPIDIWLGSPPITGE